MNRLAEGYYHWQSYHFIFSFDEQLLLFQLLKECNLVFVSTDEVSIDNVLY